MGSVAGYLLDRYIGKVKAESKAEGRKEGREQGREEGREQGFEQGREEGAFNTLLENISIIMEAGNMSLESAMKFLRISEEKQPKIKEALAKRSAQ